eukprot:TRINITY_DN1108_c0_g1_i1.p1 TRINITY_DN1108_c0_g1~~TRINITY_DN1108_c0_g1_i1.p1  ORF type:complete len:245 (+),score=43.44 TRINITY_DN1108_c0_g1_i1:42-776(+)
MEQQPTKSMWGRIKESTPMHLENAKKSATNKFAGVSKRVQNLRSSSNSNELSEITHEADVLMFGLTLSEACSNIHTNSGLPLVVEHCINALMEKEWYLEEGIFRLSTSHSQLINLKDTYNNGDTIDFDEVYDPHLPACAIKLFLRELIEPPVAPSIVPQLKSIIKSPDPNKEFVSELLTRLPSENSKLLSSLFKLLSTVCDNVDINKMTPTNLAIIFVPTLNIDQDIFMYFIEHHEYIFHNERQ